VNLINTKLGLQVKTFADNIAKSHLSFMFALGRQTVHCSSMTSTDNLLFSVQIMIYSRDTDDRMIAKELICENIFPHGSIHIVFKIAI